VHKFSGELVKKNYRHSERERVGQNRERKWARQRKKKQDSDYRSCGEREKSAAAETTAKGLHYCLNQDKYLK